MARTAWPGQDPLGKCLRLSADTTPCHSVVGIAEDAMESEVNGPATSMAYFAADQFGERQASLLVRVRGSGALHAESLRRELQKVMPGASYVSVHPLSAIGKSRSR